MMIYVYLGAFICATHTYILSRNSGGGDSKDRNRIVIKHALVWREKNGRLILFSSVLYYI